MDIAKLAKELGLTKGDREKVLKFAIALKSDEPEWLPTKLAIAKLGGISSDMLRDRIQTEFTYGDHYIDARDSQAGEVPYYLWHIEAIKELWKIRPENRQAPSIGRPAKSELSKPVKSRRILRIAS